MHSAIIALTFVAMVVSPCIVAMFNGAETEEAA